MVGDLKTLLLTSLEQAQTRREVTGWELRNRAFKARLANRVAVAISVLQLV